MKLCSSLVSRAALAFPFLLGCASAPAQSNWSFTTTGLGCPGAQPPTLGVSLPAMIGATPEIRCEGLPGDALLAFAALGNSTAVVPLDALGAIGCTMLVDSIFAMPTMQLTPLQASLPIAIPNNPSYVGVTLQVQVGAFAPSANALGLATSHRGTMLLGDRHVARDIVSTTTAMLAAGGGWVVPPHNGGNQIGMFVENVPGMSRLHVEIPIVWSRWDPYTDTLISCNPVGLPVVGYFSVYLYEDEIAFANRVPYPTGAVWGEAGVGGVLVPDGVNANGCSQFRIIYDPVTIPVGLRNRASFIVSPIFVCWGALGQNYVDAGYVPIGDSTAYDDQWYWMVNGTPPITFQTSHISELGAPPPIGTAFAGKISFTP